MAAAETTAQRVSGKLSAADIRGAVGVRLGIRRMAYTVEPGLYALGNPSTESNVFVSANYKLSFDTLRRCLDGMNAWILVIDTKGINVWCAAGKGTFGTREPVERIEATNLGDIVTHRRIVVPQLGAPGVAAHEVKRQTGFRVVYGPVRAADIPAFLDAGMKATRRMRRVRFTLRDRLTVVPVELTMGGGYAIIAAACLFLLSGLHRGGYEPTLVLANGTRSALLLLLSFACGAVLTPALLPWLPGRAFSVKGLFVGAAAATVITFAVWIRAPGTEAKLETVAWFLMMPAISAFAAMNFTGASTYTSLSGVRQEMRAALPLQVAGAVAGLAAWVAARFA
jgi:hypothetical protein